MTTIAWDGWALAADRQTTAGGTPTLAQPKARAAIGPDGSRWLYACAGVTSECHEFTRRLEAGQPMPNFTDLAVLAVDPTGCVWVAASTAGMFWECKGRIKWAAGSGADYALGAMEAGASASDAVLIASRLDINTGLGIDTLRLETAPLKPKQHKWNRNCD